MQKKQAFEMWHRLLSALSGAGPTSVIRLCNPGVMFTKDAKAGKYDKVSDTEYNSLLHAVEEEGALYRKKPLELADTLLINAIRSTHLEPDEKASICRILAEASERIDYTQSSEPDPLPEFTARIQSLSPKDICDILNGGISGQEDAKRSAAMIIFNHLNGRKRNALFAGPTGCGKSEIWRVLSRSFPAIRIFDASTLAPDGWRGSLHIRSLFEAYPENEREHAIIVLDEADKMLEPAIGSGGTDYSLMVQDNLLKILDGDVMTFEGDDRKPPLIVDCAHVSVIMLGAFERLLKSMSFSQKNSLGFGGTISGREDCDYSNSRITIEDLISHGNLRREIAGRLSSVTLMAPMDETDFMNLMDDPHVSPAVRLAEEYHMSITLSAPLKVKLARDAVKSRLGVRYIRSELQTMIDKRLFTDPDIRSLYLDVEPPEDRDAYLPFM